MTTSDTVRDATVEYDQLSQRLLINIPPNWLPIQNLASGQNQYNAAKNSFGALFNYDVYANKPDHGDASISAWNEVRFFGDYGTLSNTGVYRHSESGLNNGYLRYDTLWQFSDEKNMLLYEIGDFVARSLIWNNSIRLGGAQLSSNFSVRPDIITYPLPRFSGEVSVPSALELFIDGYRLQNDNVDPGPYNITNMPYINGAGDAVIVTTDALGRKISTTIPFYVANNLLKTGLSDYAIGLGTIRKHYGQRSADYNTFAVTGSYRYGLSDYLTLESHLEGTNKVQVLGGGGVTTLGRLGSLNLSYSQSHDDDVDYGQHKSFN